MRSNRTPFTVPKVLKFAEDFSRRCDDVQWKKNYEQFKGRVRSVWGHMFVQEHPKQKMVQITYMH